MLRAARIEDTAPGDPSSGLGLVIERDPTTHGVLSLGHAGSVMGYGANIVYYPCTGAVFAAMANVDFSPAMIDILTEVQPIVQELATAPCARPSVDTSTVATTSIPPTSNPTPSAAAVEVATEPRFTG